MITGGGRGIGEEAVKKFLMKGAKVRRYIGVLSEETCCCAGDSRGEVTRLSADQV